MMQKPPPPPPPRVHADTANLSPHREAPPPYAEADGHASGMHPLHTLATGDPRSSSTQSLVPAAGQFRDGRRKLLLVYIHGFMGDETSFQSFPAHVHNLVTVTLRESHVVHTKIYPKYRARNTIEYATEQFSRWLTPHADPDTDIILLGHSMGGLVSAEVVLLPPHGPAAFMGQAFRHRILGIINFDVPFLGMHPGIISAGLSSIFRPAEDKSPEHNSQPTGQATQSYHNHPSAHSSVSTLDLGPPLRNETLFNANPNDPNYNPRFDNDVILPVRKGWENALHFITKHSDGLVQAGRQYVKSHLEFGGTMADYPGLNKRYKRVRALEEEDEAKRRVAVASVGHNPPEVPRVRFVNFYTASTGRPKKPKTPQAGVESTDFGMSDLSLASSGQDQRRSPSHSQSVSPRISVEEPEDDAQLSPKDEVLRELSPAPLSDHDLTPTHSLGQQSSFAASLSHLDLEIPEPPIEPPLPDLEACPGAESRKTATKEYEQALKDYKRAVKDRNALIKQKAKAEEKLAKESRKEEKKAQKARKEEEEKVQKAKKEEEKSQKAKSKEEKEQAKQEQPESQKSGEELRLEKERLRVEAESQRMAEAERERMRVQRRMLGLPPEDENSEAVQQEQEEVVHQEQQEAAVQQEEQREVIQQDEPVKIVYEEQQVEPSGHGRSTSLTPSLSHPESSSPSASLSTPRTQSSQTTSRSAPPASGKKRDRKFCVTPSKDPRTGQRDPAWIRVFMDGYDEVSAHCGLFFMGETYERLVGEVAEKIEHWVLDDLSERAVRELESQII
ncbi:pgap1-like protein [Diplodia corticola]|uniref:Pgap1-like protein n=1 Tax=Diplodia corticola TaxID=236234 RepID=A0A1J9QIJ1_9PEZI|nr:pgap1-like protein [Diplodia corticola]OJD28670.1 pgap1-like protein [Diplodia corticola]